MSLAIPLSRKHQQGCPLFKQVYNGLRDAILSGAFSSGEKLPSTRDVAEQLGISRTVVLLAYDQLLAEGFAVARGGSGTYVSNAIAGTRTPSSEAPIRIESTTSHTLAFAPAIEFSWKHNIGVLVGVRVIAAGRNTPFTITPAIAVNIVH